MIIPLGGYTNISHFWNMTIEIFYIFFFFLKCPEAEYQYSQHAHPPCGRCPIIFPLETKINYQMQFLFTGWTCVSGLSI